MTTEVTLAAEQLSEELSQLKKDVVCIYHGNCADGFSGAWVVSRFFGRERVELFPGVYGNEPPADVEGKDVILVDFSYKPEVIHQLAAKAKRVLIIDHHKTALPLVEEKFPENVKVIVHMDYSGSMLAWSYFFPVEPPPDLLKHVEDRDLWRFALNGTREIQACVFSYPYDLDVWEKLMMGCSCRDMFSEGVAIERKHFKDINELLLVTMQDIIIGGIKVKAANLPYTMSSDAGHILCEKYDQAFGACFYLTPLGVVFSLRSTDNKVDVSEIAKSHGGGGHRNAAGFHVSLAEFVEMTKIYEEIA